MAKPPSSFIGKLLPQPLAQEIQKSYLDYAMSVIVARALPDVRDGLKPVARRILYSMWRQGLRSGAKFRKSAHVVGDVMARYHPHGDIPIYDTMARLVQDFSMRYPLIDGQGNWGSVDGDRPAAMRYTEARLEQIADEMLTDIEKETADFADNYDGTRQEPLVLPARLPQFLLNGTVGIAVGMATNVPPHNLSEVCDALMHLIDEPEATIDDLMKFIKGPDFPTGGAIYNRRDIQQAYATGRGGIVTRAIAKIEESKSNAQRIVVTEIPYLVNKSQLLAKIAEGVKEKRLEGIRDLRDESDKDGVRIVIELKKDAYPKKVLNRLFAATDLQKSFHVNMLALTERGLQPKVFTLKETLQAHITHRQEVVTRRTRFELARAKERAHILEGLKKALDHINEVIATIKKSQDREKAHTNLRQSFGLSDAQATAILEMRLQTLAGLERQKIADELKEKKLLIKTLEDLLAHPKKILGIVKDEYKQLRQAYGDERRTRVFVQGVGEFSQEDLVPDEPTIVILTRDGYIKRLSVTTYQVQGRGGKGVKGRLPKEEDVVNIVLTTTTHKELLFFSNRGRVFSLRAYELPVMSRLARGQALQNFLELAADEKITEVTALPGVQEKGAYFVMATSQGLIKKTACSEFTHIRRSGLKAITLKNDDTLEWVSPSSGRDHLMIVSQSGQSIRFAEKDVRPMGRGAAGVRAMRLKKNDRLVAMHVIAEGKNEGRSLIVISENGYGKRSLLSNYRLQGRGGSGVKTASVTAKTGKIVNAVILEEPHIANYDLLITSEKGQMIRIPASSVTKQGRSTQGVRVMRQGQESGQIATFALLAH